MYNKINKINKMKKTQLKNIIKESIKELMTEQSPTLAMGNCPQPTEYGPFPSAIPANYTYNDYVLQASGQGLGCPQLATKWWKFKNRIQSNANRGKPMCSPKFNNYLFAKMIGARALAMQLRCPNAQQGGTWPL